ncbi:S8 family serine peptidase [Candidatus Marithrix sp. Canyon 246]|nr:S8 family serine peptidase [Candidatus Marithrix sp. Canyon 246]
MNDVPYIKQWRSSLFALFILSIFSTMAVAESPLWSATQTNEFSKDQILVKLKSNANASSLVNIYSDVGVSHVKTFQNIGISLVEITDQNKTVDEILESLNKYDQVVEYAEPDYMMQIDSIPNDPRFDELWGLHNTGQSGGTNDADIDASEAWNNHTGDSTLVVGVIDTGVDYNHEDLAANMWVNPNEIAGNGIDDDNNGYIDDVHGINAINDDGDPMDDNGHGTHVSGTIGGVGDNGIGVTGVNWNVKIMALKFLSAGGSGSTSDAIETLEYAIMMKTQHGVNIKMTSNSWGGGGSSQAMRDAIDASQNAGMLFIAAAGNSGTDNDASPHYPSSYDLPSVIAVASTDRNDNLSSFSCFGANSVDLAAPGSSILSSTPGNQYASYSGTSMATPHVAGAAALLWAANPNDSYADIKAKLMGTVDQLASLSGKMISGGRLNINNALGCDPNNPPNLQVSLAEAFSVYQSQAVVLTASLVNCANLTGATISVNFSNGDSALTLLDDGVAPDAAANDGVYTANWTPSNTGSTTANFSATHNGNNYPATRNGTVVETIVYTVNDQHSFDWVDISGTGTNLNLSDDSHYYSIPFEFNFYGQSYSDIAVGSNGGIYFEDTNLTLSNQPIPSDMTINTFMAVLWDDLNPGAGGGIFYEIQGTAPNRSLIIQWNEVPRFGINGNTSIQAILEEATGNIIMQYLDVNFDNASYDNGASATVGLQRSADFGQQYSHNTPALSDNMAILWSLNPEEPPAAGSLQFSQATYSVNEGIGSTTITVSRTGGSDGSVSVDYAINDGTATSGNDYSATPGTLSWNDGDSSNKLITVNIIDDNNQESSENFSLVLSNATGDATIGSPNNTVVTITDNDSGDDCAHATFSVADHKITIPMLDMPLLDSLTGEPNGNIAVLQAELAMTEGVGDFKMIPESISIIAGEEPNAECHASYSYNTRIMHFPFVDVASTIVLPPNIVIDGPIQVFEANLQQLQLYNEIFHLKDYTYLYELE